MFNAEQIEHCHPGQGSSWKGRDGKGWGLLSIDVGGNKVLQGSSIHVPKLNFTEKD